jgi:hypothetical protein
MLAARIRTCQLEVGSCTNVETKHTETQDEELQVQLVSCTVERTDAAGVKVYAGYVHREIDLLANQGLYVACPAQKEIQLQL